MRQIRVDEIHLGKKQKFLTVVSNLETGEPVWFGRERKKETLDEFFEKELSARQRNRSGIGKAAGQAGSKTPDPKVSGWHRDRLICSPALRAGHARPLHRALVGARHASPSRR